MIHELSPASIPNLRETNYLVSTDLSPNDKYNIKLQFAISNIILIQMMRSFTDQATCWTMKPSDTLPNGSF